MWKNMKITKKNGGKWGEKIKTKTKERNKNGGNKMDKNNEIWRIRVWDIILQTWIIYIYRGKQ